MEDKNETGQSGNDSSTSQGSDNKDSNAGNVADKLIEDVKKFNLMSLVGIGLVLVFLLFMFFSGLTFKWWLMLPIAGASAFILYRQLSDTQGFEKKACFYALIAVGVLVLFRDIQISNHGQNTYKFANQMQAQAKGLNNALKNLIPKK